MSSNLYLKILAVFSAVFLWFFVINEGFRVDNLDTEISIQVQNLSENLMIVNDLPKVKLKLRAPTDVWQHQEIAGKLKASINLQYYNQGEYNVEVKVETQDKTIQIIEQDPENVNVVLAPILSEEKKVELETSGNLGKDYQAEKPQFSQENVKIESAQVILNKVVKIVAPIKFDGEMSEIKKTIELEARDKDNKKIDKVNIIPKTIEVIIPIVKENGEKTVGVKAQTFGTLPAGVTIDKIELDPQTIIIKGKTDKINNIDIIETKVINLAELTEDINILNPGLDLPEGVEVKDNQNVTVKIYLTQSNITKQFSGIIKYKNLSDQYKVAGIMPSHTQLTLEGPSAKINSLKAEDVYTEIDLSGKTEGTYEFNIFKENIVTPSNIAVKNVDTNLIKVIIVKK